MARMRQKATDQAIAFYGKRNAEWMAQYTEEELDAFFAWDEGECATCGHDIDEHDEVGLDDDDERPYTRQSPCVVDDCHCKDFEFTKDPLEILDAERAVAARVIDCCVVTPAEKASGWWQKMRWMWTWSKHDG